MKASELRIGNYFYDFDIEEDKGDTYQVEEICCYSKEQQTLGVRYRNGSCWSDTELLEPIPLTEEWLKKLGLKDWIFGKDNEYQVVYENRYVAFSYHHENPSLHGLTVAFTGLEVHKFQNLVFALTGEELTIQEGRSTFGGGNYPVDFNEAI